MWVWFFSASGDISGCPFLWFSRKINQAFRWNEYKLAWPGSPMCSNCSSARPTNGISIKFEIRSKFAVLWFEICFTYRSYILHMSRQCYCGDMCKISLWSTEYIMNKIIAKFHWIPNCLCKFKCNRFILIYIVGSIILYTLIYSLLG